MQFRGALFLKENGINDLECGDGSFQDLLTRESTIIFLRRRDHNVIDTISANINEFFRILMEEKSSRQQEIAIKILKLENSTIINFISNCEEVEEVANHYIKNDPTNTKMIGRLLMIMEICLTLFPETINGTFSFIPNFLSITKDISVQYFFIFCLNRENRQLSPLYEFCDSFAFLKPLIGTITDNIDGQKSVPFLIRILNSIISKNQLISTKEILTIIDYIHSQASTDPEFLAEKYKFYQSLLKTELYDVTSLICEAILDIESMNDKIQEFQVNAISFISKLIQKNPLVIQKFQFESLIKLLTCKFKEFPNHTFALKEITQIMQEFIKVPESQRNVFDIFIPVVINFMENSKNRVTLSFCYKFCNFVLREIEVVRNLSTKIDAAIFMKKCRIKVKTYNTLYFKTYGYRKPAANNPKIEITENEPCSSPCADI